MDENGNNTVDMKSVIRNVIEEFMNAERAQTEPAYKTELIEEKKRREQLERQVNELVQENRRSQAIAEEAERSAAIRAELQKLGVAKVDLAFRAVKEDIRRAEDGRLVAKTGDGVRGLQEYLSQFVTENPELLPARISGGSGVGGTHRATPAPSGDLDKLRPGMNPEELEKLRQEISRVASQTLRGL